MRSWFSSTTLPHIFICVISKIHRGFRLRLQVTGGRSTSSTVRHKGHDPFQCSTQVAWNLWTHFHICIFSFDVVFVSRQIQHWSSSLFIFVIVNCYIWVSFTSIVTPIFNFIQKCSISNHRGQIPVKKWKSDNTDEDLYRWKFKSEQLCCPISISLPVSDP